MDTHITLSISDSRIALDQMLPAFSTRAIGKVVHSDKEVKLPHLMTWDEIYALETGHLPGRKENFKG